MSALDFNELCRAYVAALDETEKTIGGGSPSTEKWAEKHSEAQAAYNKIISLVMSRRVDPTGAGVVLLLEREIALGFTVARLEKELTAAMVEASQIKTALAALGVGTEERREHLKKRRPLEAKT